MRVEGEVTPADDYSVPGQERYQETTGSAPDDSREVLTLTNYSEVYATFVRCLVSQSDDLNLTLGERFWLPFIYDTFHIQLYDATQRSSPPPTATTATPPSDSNGSLAREQIQATTYWGAGYTNDYDGLSIVVIRDILQRCFSLTSVLTTPRPFLLPWWQQFLWTLVFGGMMAMAVGGNTLVMWIVCGE